MFCAAEKKRGVAAERSDSPSFARLTKDDKVRHLAAFIHITDSLVCFLHKMKAPRLVRSPQWQHQRRVFGGELDPRIKTCNWRRQFLPVRSEERRVGQEC